MMVGKPLYRWQVTITHIPTGETVTLDSTKHRSQHAARDMGVKLIKARLAARQITVPRDFNYMAENGYSDAVRLD